jgi:hypothetical protein
VQASCLSHSRYNKLQSKLESRVVTTAKTCASRPTKEFGLETASCQKYPPMSTRLFFGPRAKPLPSRALHRIGGFSAPPKKGITGHQFESSPAAKSSELGARSCWGGFRLLGAIPHRRTAGPTSLPRGSEPTTSKIPGLAINASVFGPRAWRHRLPLLRVPVVAGSHSVKGALLHAHTHRKE